MVKGLLAFIILAFIPYFIPSAVKKMGKNAKNVAATVDGVAITNDLLDRRIKMEKAQNPFYQNIPAEYESQLRQTVLGKLIQEQVVLDAAMKMGIRVSPEEIGQTIKLDPSFTKNGHFDTEYYKSQFRPYYREQYGIDFEDLVRRELISQKLENMFNHAIIVTDREVRESYEKSHPAPVKEDDFEKSKAAEKEKVQAEQARQLFETWYAQEAALAHVKTE